MYATDIKKNLTEFMNNLMPINLITYAMNKIIIYIIKFDPQSKKTG